ncbi:MAG: polyprenyl synthetase family protein [Gammaproteobacteria bacterium]|jgi:farnesyl diphosphate synthase|nr:polyprenyl synthetase family protein [Gammaproteobacteria bacterium]MBT5406679.1 polyprenyl synthetase family protein [Gammaproteobacteria bacterium]MBT5644166.1 polyprenyl synthetase family protein [Gammaproteobacteria bacterium]MBT5863219.1 polyprenyl synthetase family protein [Gammaproteobacteria bacterium]MBT6733681.1 polyprenyl synthetase family protein [Gammaproteobacteria bacterium]|tara:strand:- start:581 stop:1465 length:885 start_codon:yes stop_codon:yes gene_type:complete
MNIKLQLKKTATDFNNYAKKYLSSHKEGTTLWDAMNYGVVNGGKRIRPFLIIELSKLLNIKKTNYMRLALATEFVHAYSLIHDDLPGMDNDDLRRGKLTTHKKFGEAVAILAGNSLLTLAFEILANPKTHQNNKIRVNLIANLAKMSGSTGLAGGQSLDLLYEKKRVSEKEIIKMHNLKTAKLFEFCMLSPLILSGKNTPLKQKEYQKYGKNFGLIFQATDDLLDYEGKKNITGKHTQKDLKKNKGSILKYKDSKEIRLYCKKLAKSATITSTAFSKSENIFNLLIHNIIGRVC